MAGQVPVGCQEGFLHRGGGQGLKGLPREVVKLTSLEIYRKHVDVALGDTALHRTCSVGWTLISKVFSNLNVCDSIL